MTDNQHSTLCFIGAGNMASSLIGGLLAKDFPPQQIIASDIDAAKLSAMQQQFGVRIDTDSNRACADADIVILAVKPQVMQTVCKALTSTQHQPLFISIAAGVQSGDIDRWLGGHMPIVRCMPNTPALVGLGAAGLVANTRVSEAQKQQAEQILQSTGITVWVADESDLDAVTAISGSGPAYFFLFIEVLQNAAIELGLNADIAASLARQTALGAATMAIDKDVTTLRRQVTSKGGTTERAIESFQQGGLQQLVLEAARAAQQRSQQLAQELSGE
jgi:pyrroline-5-carboxylate reductase